MVFNKILSTTLRSVTILALSGTLLNSAFLNSCQAMKEQDQENIEENSSLGRLTPPVLPSFEERFSNYVTVPLPSFLPPFVEQYYRDFPSAVTVQSTVAKVPGLLFKIYPVPELQFTEERMPTKESPNLIQSDPLPPLTQQVDAGTTPPTLPLRQSDSSNHNKRKFTSKDIEERQKRKKLRASDPTRSAKTEKTSSIVHRPLTKYDSASKPS